MHMQWRLEQARLAAVKKDKENRAKLSSNKLPSELPRGAKIVQELQWQAYKSEAEEKRRVR